MDYKLTILGRLDALNDYTAANRQNYHKGGRMKKDNEETIIWQIRQQLRNVHINKPVLIYYRFFEPNNRRDNDNILSCATKFVQDSLVKTKVLEDDNKAHIHNFYFDTFVDKTNPRIEITITELNENQANMTLHDLLIDLDKAVGECV